MAFRSDFSTALFVAVLVAFFGLTIAPWLVWAVALTALLLVLQILSGMERRLGLLEKSVRDPDPETGKGVGPEGVPLTRE
jgi:hypothetical protein